ncbi:MmyB family transcriptional regulator [Micromonospora fulviviridis]|uniref:MmyB family transcriptional regulator n=1 Tax=Micromonospora fulviviridis TaxID=47860 RepID=UPI003F53E093
MLDALAKALQLTGAEREHLAGLAGQILPDAHREHERIPDEARALLDRLGTIPAYIVNSRQDIVAWNRAAAALITDFGLVAPAERNAVRLALRLAGTLCNAAPATEATFARQSASQLRTAVVKHPADRALAELINEFAAHDADFAAGWRDHDVRPIPAVRKRVNHPVLGELELDRSALELAAQVRAEPGWVVLRASGFMQNFLRPHPLGERIHRLGEIRTAAGDGKVGWIDVRDIAASAAALLGDPEVRVAGDDYLLTGPESLSYGDTAEAITAHAAAGSGCGGSSGPSRPRLTGPPACPPSSPPPSRPSRTGSGAGGKTASARRCST